MKNDTWDVSENHFLGNRCKYNMQLVIPKEEEGVDVKKDGKVVEGRAAKKELVNMYDNLCNNCKFFRSDGRQLQADELRFCDKLLYHVKAGDKICHGFKYRHKL